MSNTVRGDIRSSFLLACLAVFSMTFSALSAGEAPLSPDAAAMLVLDAARRAYNEGKCDFAAERFRDFLKQYGGHKEAPSAHYGLALALLGLPQKDYNSAIASLQQVAGRADFADRPLALYYLASAQRGLGGQAMDQAAAKPNEAPNFRNVAAQQFNEAARNFAAAADLFATRAKAAAPASPDLEWFARSRCDQCDMLLRLDKPKEAADLAQALLADKRLEKSRYRELALYDLGYATFVLRDYLAAGRALSQLAPFQQEFGAHARYLLSRTHHLTGERPEAVAGYKALLTPYEQRKKDAAEAMKNPGALKPEQRARFEALLKGPPPEYIIRASFYTSLLQAEDGNVAEALAGFGAILQQYPAIPLADEVRLRQGYCQLQVRNFAEAIKVLQPLQNHPQLADRAMWWLARAQVGAADPNNAQAYEQALRPAMDMLARAADKAGELGRTDPEAKARRADILLELGDTQQLAKAFREAANTYQRVLGENANPGADGATSAHQCEEAMQRQATALHLAGMYRESDELCRKFEQTYPKSSLLAAVWFRAAENACLPAIAAANDPNMRSRRAEVDKMFDQAIPRYERVLAKYPEFPYANLARYGLATAQYQRGLYAEAIQTLSAILDAERAGELTPVNYLIADCHVRLFPPEAADALQAGQMLDRAEQAAKLLEKYIAALPKGPQAPNLGTGTAGALLKLGYCLQRMGILLADPAEKQKTLTQARQIYERVMQEFGATPAMPPAVMERARCMALMGDPNGAINELNRFNAEPLRQSPVAPLALIRMACLMRAQNRPAEALTIMTQCRQHEGNLQNDPERRQWIPLLQYEHALAVKESGKLAEARTMFEAIAKQFAARPEAADALWRAGQCRREELLAALAAARTVPLKPGVRPDEIAAATKSIEDGLATLRQTADYFKTEAAKLKAGTPPSEACLRMFYEAAWCCRALADAEIEVARQKLQREGLRKVLANLQKANQPAPALNPADIPLSAVPPQPSEKAAREQYTALIAAASRSPLTPRVRLELAEMDAQRGRNDGALELLAAALEDSPPPDLAERIHLRIATCLLAKKDVKGALAQAQAVTKNAASPLAGEARLLTGEILIQSKDVPGAIAQLVAFRDQDPWRNMPGLAERALLRLGCVLAQAQKWDESRQAMDILIQRFPQSPWVYEARYGIGWAWQNANQHDNACNAYMEVTRGTASEVAARAQFQMGLCRLAQKRFPEAAKELLAVSYTYDYPEHSAAALCEAGQAYLEQKQPGEAAKLWQRVVADFAASTWAGTAKQRLAALK